jgi:hypothetical protein
MIAKGSDFIAARIKELKEKSESDKRESYQMFSEQSPLERAKSEIKKHLEAAVLYRISVLENVSTFGTPNQLLTATFLIVSVFRYSGIEDYWSCSIIFSLKIYVFLFIGSTYFFFLKIHIYCYIASKLVIMITAADYNCIIMFITILGDLSLENLSFAAQNMGEVFFVKGDHIIVQVYIYIYVYLCIYTFS